MAEVLGTTASIVALTGTAISLVQHLKKARASVQGSSKSLDDMSAQLDAVSASLSMVQAEPQIQTLAVKYQVNQIVTVEKELQGFCQRLKAQQTKGPFQQYVHSLKSGDENDKELAQILTKLDHARSELHLRISVINVGLVGSLQEGFHVAWRTLERTNALLRQGLGVTLTLAERLSNREFDSPDSDVVALEASDVEALGLGSPTVRRAEARTGTSRPELDERNHLRWHNSNTGDKARFNVGNMGMDADVAIPTAKVSDSTFGDGFRMMVGHVNENSAESFNNNFWNN